MASKLIAARRDVERLEMEAAGAAPTDVKIWEAGHRVADLERDEREAAVRTALRAALVMDAVLLVVAVLTMGFSLQNIHDFARSHGVQDPIAWFVAPAVDLALVAALVGDAVLSRHQLDAGKWATTLRWYAGAATVVLNSWESWATLDAAGILLHTAMPVLLFVLAEAASPYRRRFAETVRMAAATVQAEADTATVSTPAPAEADTVDTDPEPVLVQEPDTADDHQADEAAMSTMTPQVTGPAPTWHSESRKAVDWVFSGEGPMPVRTVGPTGKPLVDTPTERLDADAARRAIEDAWTDGLTVREAAARATRSPSYVGGVYAQLTKARGTQPSKGQMRIEGEAA